MYLDTTLKKSQWKNDDAYLIEQRLLSIFSTTLNDHNLGGVHHGFNPDTNRKMGSNGSPVDILKTLAHMDLNKPESSVTIYDGPMVHPSIKDKALDVIRHLSQTAAFDKRL